MTESEKREEIKKMVKGMFQDVVGNLDKQVNKVLNSGAVDVADWDKNNNPMLLPKSILIAFLRDEADQYTAKGTSFEKQVADDAKNIGYYL